jgi:hypothetical protein
MDNINDAEFWLLNSLCNTVIAISLLDPREVNGHFAVPHGLELEPLVGLIEDMLGSNYVTAEEILENEGKEIRYKLDKEELVALVTSFDRDVVIRLTPNGGARWEQLAQPNWGDYVSQSFDHGNFLSLTSMDRRLLVDYLEMDGVKQQIIRNTTIWDTVEPWKPTYWKTLPCEAFLLRFKHRGMGMPRAKCADIWPKHPYIA